MAIETSLNKEELSLDDEKKNKLIVGLGNPGEKYQRTRHNVGFMFVDYFSKKWDMPLDVEKKKTTFGRKSLPKYNTDIILLKPLTFSSLAMEAVLYIASFLKVDRQNIMVVYDDITCNLGEYNMDVSEEKLEHNGVKNLINFFMGDDFSRCGIGIGPLLINEKPEKFYLSNLEENEIAKLQSTFDDLEPKFDEFLKKKADTSETVGQEI